MFSTHANVTHPHSVHAERPQIVAMCTLSYLGDACAFLFIL